MKAKSLYLPRKIKPFFLLMLIAGIGLADFGKVIGGDAIISRPTNIDASLNRLNRISYNGNFVVAGGTDYVSWNSHSNPTDANPSKSTRRVYVESYNDVECYDNNSACIACGIGGCEKWTIATSSSAPNGFATNNTLYRTKAYVPDYRAEGINTVAVIQGTNYFLTGGYIAVGIARWDNTGKNSSYAMFNKFPTPSVNGTNDVFDILSFRKSIYGIVTLKASKMFMIDITKLKNVLEEGAVSNSGFLVELDWRRHEQLFVAVSLSSSTIKVYKSLNPSPVFTTHSTSDLGDASYRGSCITAVSYSPFYAVGVKNMVLFFDGELGGGVIAKQRAGGSTDFNNEPNQQVWDLEYLRPAISDTSVGWGTEFAVNIPSSTMNRGVAIAMRDNVILSWYTQDNTDKNTCHNWCNRAKFTCTEVFDYKSCIDDPIYPPSPGSLPPFPYPTSCATSGDKYICPYNGDDYKNDGTTCKADIGTLSTTIGTWDVTTTESGNYLVSGPSGATEVVVNPPIEPATPLFLIPGATINPLNTANRGGSVQDERGDSYGTQGSYRFGNPGSKGWVWWKYSLLGVIGAVALLAALYSLVFCFKPESKGGVSATSQTMNSQTSQKETIIIKEEKKPFVSNVQEERFVERVSRPKIVEEEKVIVRETNFNPYRAKKATLA